MADYRFLAATLICGLVSAGQVQAATVPVPPAPNQALQALIAQQVAALGITPKTTVVPSDEGFDTAAAIRRGDYAQAGRIADKVFASSKLQSGRFYPFNDFIGSIATGGEDPGLLQHLNDWVKSQPKSAMAYLIRATYYHQAGWAARGDDVMSRVPVPLQQVFNDDMARATADVTKSISLNPRNPWSHFLLLRILGGQGNSNDAAAAFLAGIRVEPGYYDLYRLRLNSLTPKWGGSIAAMYAFVAQYAGKAPENSPLRLLYLQLYADLLDAAAFNCGWTNQRCMNAETARTVTPELQDELVKAVKLYTVSDPIEFNTALWSILGEIVATPGNGSSALGGLLEVAANVMGSDNRLMDEPGHNSYVLDDITARVWSQIGNNGNADAKFKEALSDVEHTSFKDPAQKAAAMAAIYDHMTAAADRTNQYMNVIVYHEAADAVGGVNHGDRPYMTCYGYYALKDYASALQECTTVIERNGNYLASHYWRAKAYEHLEQWDAALAEYAPIADSANNWFRVGAALNMSMILGSRKDDSAGELALFNAHPYLFDAHLQQANDLAVAYNNRCAAYKRLGQLQKALDDCTASLKYGRIPDAYQKQLELVKALPGKAL